LRVLQAHGSNVGKKERKLNHLIRRNSRYNIKSSYEKGEEVVQLFSLGKSVRVVVVFFEGGRKPNCKQKAQEFQNNYI
jgi:hypothetical protein